MTSQFPPDYVLNLVTINVTVDKLRIGRLPPLTGEEYRELRETHWQTHAFRYDNRTDETLNICLQDDVSPLGKIDEVPIEEHLLLVARAIQQSILIWLSKGVTILRGGKTLVFWGQANHSQLLSRAAEQAKLEPIPGLEVALRYEIDCRMFQGTDDQPFLALVVDVGTSNIIDIPISELLKQGFDPCGHYVCRRREWEHEYLHPKLDLVGRVTEVQGDMLLLSDTNGTDRVSAQEVFIEPRAENLNEVVELYYGNQAQAVLSELSDVRNLIHNADGKLDQIRLVLNGLKTRKQHIPFLTQIGIEFGDLLTSRDGQFLEQIATQRPTLVFGAQGRRTGSYPDRELTSHGPYMYMQHVRNEPLIAVICEARNRGRVEQFVEMLRSGFPQQQWQNQKRSNPFPEGLIGKYRLSRVRVEYEECRNATPQAYRDAIERILHRLPELPDLAIIQIQQAFEQLRGNANPYFVSKAAFMSAGVPTQSIQIEKINLLQPGLAYLLNNIALAIYAKLDGIPWVMATSRPTTHELIVGLGAAEVSSSRSSEAIRYVGITSVFQGDGRYLVWGLTREVEFTEYATALLESLQTTVRYVQQQNAWQEGDRVRLVCHCYKRLRNCEVDAIKSLVRGLISENFHVEFAFLDVSWHHPYYIFSPSQSGVEYRDWQNRSQRVKGQGVPDRGLCLQLSNHRGLLHLIGPQELKTADQGIPQPLLVELHPDSDFTDMIYLLRQIYHFTYMSWRSFFPSGEPVTITYSRLIARLLGNLKTVNGWDSRTLTVGRLRDRRWFL